MAAVKKVTTKPEVKATETAVKTAVPKTEEKAEVKKPEAPAKKEAVKKAEKKPELKAALHVQFAGKSYAEEDLMKMAKDVWKYDLKQKAGDLVSVELYVKPEESAAYYVVNGVGADDYKIEL